MGAQAIVETARLFPLATFEANIKGTYNLIEACRVNSHLVKSVVIASSDKAYGQQPVLPYTEDMTLSGRHPYEVSKTLRRPHRSVVLSDIRHAGGYCSVRQCLRRR